MTRETVAEDRPRCAASSFKLMEVLPVDEALLGWKRFALAMGVLERSLAQRRRWGQGVVNERQERSGG